MEENSSTVDILVNGLIKQSEKKQNHLILEKTLRKRLMKWIMCFKTYFTQSIQWAPRSQDEKLVFPFNLVKRTYDRSVLNNEVIQSDPFWGKHIGKIEEYFNELDQIKNINPISIPVYNLTSVFIAFCSCTQLFLSLYVLSIVLYANKKIGGEIFWVVFLPFYAIITILSCAITHKIVSNKLSEKIADRAKEIYLLTFFYNTNYFADYDLYIHMGVFSSWIDIGPVLDTDFLESDTLDAEIMQRSLTFDTELHDEVSNGRFINESDAFIDKDRKEIYNEAENSKINKEKKQFYVDSMTASYFFPTTKTTNTRKVIMTKGNESHLCENAKELQKDGKAFFADSFKVKKLNEKKHLQLFAKGLIKNKKHNPDKNKCKCQIKRLSGNGKPAQYSQDHATEIFLSSICPDHQKKLNEDEKNEQLENSIVDTRLNQTMDKYLSKMATINEVETEKSSCGGNSVTEVEGVKDVEIDFELNQNQFLSNAANNTNLSFTKKANGQEDIDQKGNSTTESKVLVSIK